MGGMGSGRSPHLGAASKCEHWRSIDLADLKRMGLLKPIVGDRIRAITWKNDHGGFDKLGIIPSARGMARASSQCYQALGKCRSGAVCPSTASAIVSSHHRRGGLGDAPFIRMVLHAPVRANKARQKWSGTERQLRGHKRPGRELDQGTKIRLNLTPRQTWALRAHCGAAIAGNHRAKSSGILVPSSWVRGSSATPGIHHCPRHRGGLAVGGPRAEICPDSAYGLLGSHPG
jgi:hypothetical protein